MLLIYVVPLALIGFTAGITSFIADFDSIPVVVVPALAGSVLGFIASQPVLAFLGRWLPIADDGYPHAVWVALTVTGVGILATVTVVALLALSRWGIDRIRRHGVQ